MNKKGFTLIELLAVIVIIAIVSLIGTVSIVGVKKSMNKKMFETKLSEITSAAAKWGEDNKSEIKEITLYELISKKYFQTEEYVKTDVSTCESYHGTYDANEGVCRNVVINNINGEVINNLILSPVIKNNRVYAVIPYNEYNYNILKDVDEEVYKEYVNEEDLEKFSKLEFVMPTPPADVDILPINPVIK